MHVLKIALTAPKVLERGNYRCLVNHPVDFRVNFIWCFSIFLFRISGLGRSTQKLHENVPRPVYPLTKFASFVLHGSNFQTKQRILPHEKDLHEKVLWTGKGGSITPKDSFFIYRRGIVSHLLVNPSFFGSLPRPRRATIVAFPSPPPETSFPDSSPPPSFFSASRPPVGFWSPVTSSSPVFTVRPRSRKQGRRLEVPTRGKGAPCRSDVFYRPTETLRPRRSIPWLVASCLWVFILGRVWQGKTSPEVSFLDGNRSYRTRSTWCDG